MEASMSFIADLTGKTVSVKTHGGAGTKDASLTVGEYKGILLGVDGNFIKLEYEIKKFTNGVTSVTKDIIFLNISYIISVSEYHSKEE